MPRLYFDKELFTSASDFLNRFVTKAITAGCTLESPSNPESVSDQALLRFSVFPGDFRAYLAITTSETQLTFTVQDEVGDPDPFSPTEPSGFSVVAEINSSTSNMLAGIIDQSFCAFGVKSGNVPPDYQTFFLAFPERLSDTFGKHFHGIPTVINASSIRVSSNFNGSKWTSPLGAQKRIADIASGIDEITGSAILSRYGISVGGSDYAGHIPGIRTGLGNQTDFSPGDETTTPDELGQFYIKFGSSHHAVAFKNNL